MGPACNSGSTPDPIAVVHAVRHAEPEVEHAHLEHVAGCRTLDINGPREHMRARIFGALGLVVNIERIRQHFACRYAPSGEELDGIHVVDDALVRNRVDRHRLP